MPSCVCTHDLWFFATASLQVPSDMVVKVLFTRLLPVLKSAVNTGRRTRICNYDDKIRNATQLAINERFLRPSSFLCFFLKKKKVIVNSKSNDVT